MSFPLNCIELNANDEDLWEIITGIRVKNGIDANVKITEINFIQTGDRNLNKLDEFSTL